MQWECLVEEGVGRGSWRRKEFQGVLVESEHVDPRREEVRLDAPDEVVIIKIFSFEILGSKFQLIFSEHNPSASYSGAVKSA